MDRARRDMWAGRPPSALGAQPTANEIAAAAAHDPRVWRAAMRRFNLLDHPDTILTNERRRQHRLPASRRPRNSTPQPDHGATTSCRPSP
jgi:hypothetical protein